jgi:hypothetical protein
VTYSTIYQTSYFKCIVYYSQQLKGVRQKFRFKMEFKLKLIENLSTCPFMMRVTATHWERKFRALWLRAVARENHFCLIVRPTKFRLLHVLPISCICDLCSCCMSINKYGQISSNKELANSDEKCIWMPIFPCVSSLTLNCSNNFMKWDDQYKL